MKFEILNMDVILYILVKHADTFQHEFVSILDRQEVTYI